MLRTMALAVALAGAAGLTAGVARADEASHKKAAEELLDSMEIEKQLAASIDVSLQAQIKANPGVAQFKGVFKEFMNKHMS